MGYTRTISFRSDESIDQALQYITKDIKENIPLKEISESNVIKGCIYFTYEEMKKKEQMYNK